MDKSGTRIDTDIVDVEDLRPRQKIRLTAFELVDEDKISDLKNATFRVLKVEKYDY